MNQDQLFDQLKQQAAEGTERWEEINRYYDTLKHLLENGHYAPDNMSVGMMSLRLLLLLVDQMRPMSTAPEQVDNLQKEIQDLLGTFAGGKNNGR